MSLHKQVLADRVLPPHGLPVTKDSPEIDIQYSQPRQAPGSFVSFPSQGRNFDPCPPQRRIFSSLLVSDGGISHQPSLAALRATRGRVHPPFSPPTPNLCGFYFVGGG